MPLPSLPEYASRTRTARKVAGMETRPLASILFVNVETKRSIPLGVLPLYAPVLAPFGKLSGSLTGTALTLVLPSVTQLAIALA